MDGDWCFHRVGGDQMDAERRIHDADVVFCRRVELERLGVGAAAEEDPAQQQEQPEGT